MADTLKKSILGIIWHLGWFGMGQNTPTGCGNNLPILLRSHMLYEKYVLLVYCLPYIIVYSQEIVSKLSQSHA